MTKSRRHFDRDDLGRTSLFHFAATGNLEEVERIIFSLSGTGMSGERRALIEIEDHSGRTAIDVAADAGHEEVRSLLRKELIRMEMYE